MTWETSSVCLLPTNNQTPTKRHTGQRPNRTPSVRPSACGPHPPHTLPLFQKFPHHSPHFTPLQRSSSGRREPTSENERRTDAVHASGESTRAPRLVLLHGVLALRRRCRRRPGRPRAPARRAAAAVFERRGAERRRGGVACSAAADGGGGRGGGWPAPGHRRVPGGDPLGRVAGELLPPQLRRPPRLPRVADRHHRPGFVWFARAPPRSRFLRSSWIWWFSFAGGWADEPDGEARGGHVAARAGGHGGPEAGGHRRLLRRTVRPAGARRGGEVHRRRLQEGQGQGIQWGLCSSSSSLQLQLRIC